MNVKISFFSLTIVALLFSIPYNLQAQRKERPIKPLLLVYGSDVEAFAAALQSAKSNVPTLWVLDLDQFVPSLTGRDISVEGKTHIDGGIWREFLKELSPDKRINDTLIIQTKRNISSELAQTELRNMLSQQKNLIVRENISIQKLMPTKRGWNLVLSDRSRYDVRTLVDASQDQGLIGILGKDTNSFVPNHIAQTKDLSKELARTVCAVGLVDDALYGFTLQDILKEEQEGVFVLSSLKQFDRTVETIPLRMHYAQAVGAAAAYTAFFRKPLSDLDNRTLQGELLTYGGRIVPYTDISVDHAHFRAIERIYLAGIFDNTHNVFGGQDSVRFDEVAPILNQLYSRSQLWFHEHKGEYLRLKDIISLVKFLGMKGDDIDRQIEKDWSSRLKFEKEFDVERLATREEFGVLLDRFSNPFGVRVSREGIIRR